MNSTNDIRFDDVFTLVVVNSPQVCNLPPVRGPGPGPGPVPTMNVGKFTGRVNWLLL